MKMMDVMRQVPVARKKNRPTKATKDSGKGENELATSLAQKKKDEEADGDDAACYCCGDKKCHRHRCRKRSTLPKE